MSTSIISLFFCQFPLFAKIMMKSAVFFVIIIIFSF